MPDQTTRRISRLEGKVEARGPQVDVSWILDIIADVYQSEREPGKLIMRQADFEDFSTVVLAIYGKN